MKTDPRHVWVNGVALPADGSHVSAFDRGFQLGDGVFETLRARGGRPAELDGHLARLRHSAGSLEIPLPRDADALITAGVRELLSAEGLSAPDGDAAIRVTVTRGAFTGRGILPPRDPEPTIVIQAWRVLPPTPEALEAGVHVVTSAVRRDPASPLAALKTTSRADFVFARLEARAAGADDAIFVTIDGHLSEATSANIFIVRGRALATPSLDCAILPGTTRTWLLQWGARVGLEPTEGHFEPADLATADEAFLSSSVAGVLAITRFDGASIAAGTPGPWTRRARAEREAYLVGDEA
jgi:branched-chain amino acid aminotransferase